MGSKTISYESFEWDQEKAKENLKKHGVDFFEAINAFLDPKRIIAIDDAHSEIEQRFFCVGKVGSNIMTVRFTYRRRKIRIIGAGYWRKGRRFYEKESK